MKTLTEVIEAQERCETYPNCHFCFLHAGPVCGWIRDALYYLKMYRSDKAQWEADRKNWEDERQKAIHATKKARERYIALAKDTKDELAVLRDFWAEQQANPALSWEELKQMEGKPVYLEQYWYPMEDEAGVTEDEAEIDKYWAVIDNVQAKRIHFVGKSLNMGLAKSDLDPNKHGGWQAYRKERS